jgi:ActR/RegA family two-component response regulator
MRIAARRKVAACVLDYHLNNGDTGENVAQDLRAMHPQMPLILLTGEVSIPQSARDSVDQVLIKGSNSISELASTLTLLLAGITRHET